MRIKAIPISKTYHNTMFEPCPADRRRFSLTFPARRRAVVAVCVVAVFNKFRTYAELFWLIDELCAIADPVGRGAMDDALRDFNDSVVEERKSSLASASVSKE